MSTWLEVLHEYAQELCETNPMLKSLQSLREQREVILNVAAKHGASNVRVFGSVARGEADKASDIDFLVSFDPKRSLFDLGALIADLEDLLDAKVDVAPEDWLGLQVRDYAIRDATPL